MTGALLCPGPSLAHVSPADVRRYDIRVGNRAATAHECTHWAALDYPLIRDWHARVIGTPVLLTRRQTWIDVQRHTGPRSVRLVEDLPAPPVKQWDLRTATAALVMLATMPVTRIDVYGADWTNEPDWDDTAIAEDRTAARWAQESVVWMDLSQWLYEEHGVSVGRAVRE